jgi:hypothetical protein
MSDVSAICEMFNAQSVRDRWQAACDSTLAFENGRLAELLEIWRSVRGARSLPERTDFSARILVRHLASLSFVECVASPGCARRYRFRLFGSALAEVTGDWTGRFLEEAVPPQFQASWFAAYDAVIAARVPMRFVAQFRAEHLQHVRAETLLAPLGSEAGATGLLVSVVYSPQVT